MRSVEAQLIEFRAIQKLVDGEPYGWRNFSKNCLTVWNDNNPDKFVDEDTFEDFRSRAETHPFGWSLYGSSEDPSNIQHLRHKLSMDRVVTSPSFTFNTRRMDT